MDDRPWGLQKSWTRFSDKTITAANLLNGYSNLKLLESKVY